MAIFNDPLIREEDPLDPERGSRDFGLRLFKSAEEAFRKDVAPKAAQSTPQDVGLQALDRVLFGGASGGGQAGGDSLQALDSVLFGKPMDAAPKVEQGNFSRGLSVSGKQLRQTAYGTAALVGDTLGSDSLKDWGLKGYQAAEKEVQAISKESDSFTNAVQSGEIGKWLTYSSGYLLGQVAELGVASLAGAAVGTLAAPGGGTIAGAAAGAIEKGAVQAGVRGFVGKMIDKQVAANVARGMTQEAAAQSALRSVYGTIGATTANTFLNATQELGSIYGDAVEEAALTGKEYSLGKVWLSGIAATAVDSWADSKALGNIFGAAKGDKKLSGIAMEALKGGFREGMTEGVQTAIERWGADKDLTSKEAFKEYIDSAAVGILGGSVSGAGAGAINKITTPSDKPKADAKLTEDVSTEAAIDKAQPKLEAPVAIERDELISVLRSPEAMAYLYQKASDEQKLNIEKAIEKAGAIEAFNQVKGQADAIQKGEAMLLEFPEYQQALDGAIAGFAKSPSLNIQKGKTLEAPPSQLDAQPASTASPQKPMDRVVAYLQTTQMSEEMRNDPLVAMAAAASAVAFKNEKVSDPRTWTPEESAAWKAGNWETFSKIRGYSDKEIAQYKEFQKAIKLVREKYGEDAVFEFENPDVQQGVYDAIYGKGAYRAQEKIHSDAKVKADVAERQQEMREMLRTQDETYNGVETQPIDESADQGLSTAEVSFKRDGMTVSRTGYAINFSFDRPIPVGNLTVEAMALLGDRTRFAAMSVNSGQVKVLVDELSLEIDAINSGKFARIYKTDGPNPSSRDERLIRQALGDKVVDEFFSSGFDKTQEAVSKAIVGRDLSGEADSITQEFDKKYGASEAIDAPTKEKLSKRKEDQSMGPSDPADLSKFQQAKQELKDAAAQALDIVMDVSNAKMNITGKQYTVKDLPKAIQRVMEALVKMGYYKLEEISAQVMARMKASENWKDLADKVTPNMLRVAYMKLDFPQKEKPSDVNKVKTETLQGLISKEYAYTPAERQTPAPSEMGKATGNMKGAQAETTIDNPPEDSASIQTPEEIEYDKYIAKEKPVRTPIAPAKLTPVLRKHIGSLRPADQKEAMLKMGSMSDADLKRFEADLVGMEQRRQQREEESQRGQSGDLGLQEVKEKTTPSLRDFAARVNEILTMRADTQFLRSTVTRMQQALDEIDKSLRGNRKFEENGKVYEAVDDADENSYIWSNMGMGKDLPQEKMLAMRRNLVNEIREMQARSVQGQADLFRNSLKRIEYDLSIARARAIQSGLPMDRVDKIYTPARDSVVAMIRELKGKNKIEEMIPLDARGPLADAIQGDFFEADKAARILVQAVKDGSLNATDAMNSAIRGMRDGSFTYGDLLSVMRENGVSIPHALLSMSGQIATQKRMLDHVKDNGFNQFYREAWLRSMDNVVSQFPQALDGDTFTDAEKLAYDEFKEARAKLQSATKVDETMQYSNDAEQAFDGLLFSGYTLARLRGDSIPTRTAEALKDTYGDPVETWFQHVAFALQTRPDLRAQITEMIKPEDMAEFKAWVQRKEDQVVKAAEVNAKAPYFQALTNMAYLPDEMFERFRNDLAISQAHEAEKIIANAHKLNQAIGSRKLSEADLELILADYMDRAKLDGDLELDVDGTMGRESAPILMSDESVEDLANTDEGFEFQQEEGDPDELRFKRGLFSGVLTAAQVQSVVARITNKWRNAPQITVLQNATMLPEPLRSKVTERTGDLVDAKGLFDSETGQVYLFSDHIGSESDAQFVLFHEVYGHYGLRAFLGAKFDGFLDQMYNLYPQVRQAADAKIQDGMPKAEAIDEVLSDLAGTNPDIGPVKSFVARLVVGLREIGLGKVADWIAKLSNVELSYYLKGARDAAQNGGYINNGAPGVIRLAEAIQHERLSEMYALSGDKTKAYARFNPVTQSWFAYFATGNDVREGAGAVVMDNYNDLLKLMRSKGHVEFRKRSGVSVPDRKVSDFVKLTEITNLSGMKAWMRSMITKYQNEYRPVFDLVDAMRAAGRLTERMDIKDALLRYERKTGAVVDEFRRRFVRPLQSYVEDAGKKGATSKIIDRYLLARHAEERNKQIARINQQFPDGGSGMMTKTAQRYLKKLEKQPYWQELQEIGRITDQISQKKLKYQLDTGMITAKQYQAMQVYKHYVNLSGRSDLKLDEFDDPMMLAGGSKFNVKGKEKRALGRESEATEILSRTILGMEAALIRGQKNQVAQRVLAFFEANYDPNFVTINKIAYKPVIGEDGMVTDKEDDAYIRNPNVMVAKINGIPNTIEFKDTSAGSFAEAIHGVVGVRDSSALLERLGQFNQVVGQMLTTWNPAWGFVNFARDLQTMFFNAAADGRITKSQAAQMVKTIPEALKIAYYMARTENLKNTNVSLTPEQVRIYREMKLNGGLTSFLNRKDLPNQVEEIQKLLGERSRLQVGKDKFLSLMDAIEHNFSTPIEIAPRLAAYKVMREAGMSEAQAAQFAGEITVNFNMRGSVKATRQLYLFFNPAVQGSAKLLSLFGTLTPDYKLKFKTKGFAYVGLWVGLGAMMNLIGRALSDDDESGRNSLDKLPVYKRATSMVFSADTPGASIPIPYGWNAFYGMGHFMMDSLLGIHPITTSVKRIAQTAFESFAPLGSAGLDSQSLTGTVLKGVAPTAALPIVEWVMNENRYGAPIRREDSVFGGAKLPDSQMAFRSVNPLSDAAMKTINEITGGNKFKSGAIDANPAAVDFIIGSYMPGFINESYKFLGMQARLAKGEDVKNTPLPLIDRFTAKTPESYDAGAFRRAKELIETRFNEYKNMPELRDEIRKEVPGLMHAHAIVASITQQIRKERANLIALENNKDVPDAEKTARLNRMREREKQLYGKAVKAVMNAGPEFRETVMASD